jgi:putative oxidoreductase
MLDWQNLQQTWQPRLLSLMRIIVGLLFVQHGVQKLFGGLGGERVELLSLMGLAGVLEFGCGLLLVAGLCTRPVAFILAGEMASAYFMVHAPQGFWPILNKGELAVLYCFAFLYMAVAGPGPWSVDGARRKAGASHAG